MWGVSAQPKGVRHECYDCIGQSCHCLESCFEIDRPSWQTGSSPPRSKPITLPAASRLPLATIGAAGSADSMSARAIMSPLQMPDIRLQAHPNCHNYRSTSCPAGGVHIRRVSPSTKPTSQYAIDQRRSTPGSHIENRVLQRNRIVPLTAQQRHSHTILLRRFVDSGQFRDATCQ